MQCFGLYVAVAVAGVTCEEYAYRVAMLGWIVANFTWMMSDFMFDGMREPSERLPWNVGPLLHANDDSYERGLLATRITLCCTLLFLSLFYIRTVSIHFQHNEFTQRNQALLGRGGGSGVRTAKTSSLHQYALPQEFYHIFFVTAWIIKDLCWTYELLVGALTAAFVLLALMLAQLMTRGLVSPVLQLAEFIWVVGNTIWVISELWDDDNHKEPRCTACFFLLCGVVMACVNLWGDKFLPATISLAVQGTEEEKKPLLLQTQSY